MANILVSPQGTVGHDICQVLPQDQIFISWLAVRNYNTICHIIWPNHCQIMLLLLKIQLGYGQFKAKEQVLGLMLYPPHLSLQLNLAIIAWHP